MHLYLIKYFFRYLVAIQLKLEASTEFLKIVFIAHKHVSTYLAI